MAMQFNDEMVKSLALNLAKFMECQEKFGKAGLDAIDNCSLKGGEQHKKILEYREEAGAKFKKAGEYVQSHIEELERAVKDILGYDFKSQMKKAGDELGGLGNAKNIEGETVALDL